MYAQPGEDVPPPPIDEDTKESFVQSIADPIFINEEDTEDQVRIKAMVSQMKHELAEFIKGGGTFEEYFKQIHVRQEAEVALKNDVYNEFESFAKSEEDEEISFKFWKRCNEILTSKGMAMIPLEDNHRKFLTQEELDAYDNED